MKMTWFHQVAQLAFMPKLFPVNVYLVEEENGLTLIDAGMGFSAKGILETARQIGKPIERILLTHAHQDHVGALDALMSELPGVELALSEREARLLSGDKSLDPGEAQTPVKGGVPAGMKARPTRLLRHGDRIGSLEVVACPGHTPGHVAYFDVRSRALIAGDALQTRGGIAVAGVVRPLFPFPAFGTWSRETALDSARTLAALQPACLAVGHGRMLPEPAAAMKQAIADAEAAIAKKAARVG